MIATPVKPLVRGIAAAAAVVLGVVLLLVSLNVHQIAAVTGIGLALAGVMLLLRPNPTGRNVWLARLAAIALMIAGVVSAVWPTAGAPWLARMIAIALILVGATNVISAPSKTDNRLAGVLIGLATIAVGVIALFWPALTLVLFRIAVAAWLVFTGLFGLFELWRESRGDKTETDAATKPRSTFSRWIQTIGAALALVLAGGLAWGSSAVLGGAPKAKPDAFYTAPSSVPAEPGRLIRFEPLFTGTFDGTKAYKILYTTTNPDGSAAISSGTVLAPKSASASDEPLPVISISHGTTGVIDACAPSLSTSPWGDGAAIALEQMVAEHGYAAVMSDYTGMGTVGTPQYLVGEAEARNVLDASLAARELTELSVSADTVLWGHSQGGQGALWSGQFAGEYAPELNILGVAAMAPASDVYGLANEIKSDVSGKVISAYIASTWNEVFPQLSLASELTPGSALPVQRISELCFNGFDALSALLRGSQVMNQVFPDSVLEGELGRLLKQQEPTGPWTAPVMVAQGLTDPIVLPQMQQSWVDARCAAGDVIDYRTYEGFDHLTVIGAESKLTGQLVAWTLERFAGVPGPTSCESSTYAR